MQQRCRCRCSCRSNKSRPGRGWQRKCGGKWGGGKVHIHRDGWREGFIIRIKGGRVSDGMRQDGANWMMWEEGSDRV